MELYFFEINILKWFNIYEVLIFINNDKGILKYIKCIR